MMFRPLFEGQVCSLGYQVIDWLEAYTCHGPGDVQGDPITFDDETFDFIVGAYELDPKSGRRKRQKVVYSAPKGRAKSETAGLIGVAEALGPVRFDGWDADGQPVGRPVRSPFIRALATEEKQSGNTFQNIAFVMGEWGQGSHPDVYGGIRGIGDYRSAQNIYLPDGGECRSSSSGAASKDGGKETFLIPDEVHLYVLPELRNMYATAMRNLGKRKAADPWALLTTTACRLGEQSVWETIQKQWRKGELGPDWLVHHREAKGRIDIHDRPLTIRQLHDVYGPAMAANGWMDAERVYADMLDPTVCPDEQTAARYYLNRSMAGSDAWIAIEIVARQTRPRTVNSREAIAVGFDGSLNEDSTVIRGCCMSDGYRFTLGLWEKPAGPAGQGWEVPRTEVMARLRDILRTRNVSRLYADPHEWRTDVDTLASEFGEDVVVPWATSRDTQMGYALDRLHADLVNGSTFHDGDKVIAAHYGNAFVRTRGKLRLVRKEYPNSPRKIDGVVADALAYEARADALAAGWVGGEAPPTIFFLGR